MKTRKNKRIEVQVDILEKLNEKRDTIGREIEEDTEKPVKGKNTTFQV